MASKMQTEESWQSTLGNPIDRLEALYKHSRLTDLTITLPDHDETIKVHRLILGMSSPVFESMLFGPLAEGDSIRLPEDPPDAFKWLIKYIYSGKSNLPNVNLALQVQSLASKYQMDNLMACCSEYLQENLDSTNVAMVYEHASLLQDTALTKECTKYVCENAEAYFASSDVGRLSKNFLKHLLHQELFVQSEATVFQGLLKWGRIQLDDTYKKTSSQEQHLNIAELLPLVRFLTMTTDEFVAHVIKTNVFTAKESVSILLSIKKGTDETNLPNNCNRSRSTRTNSKFLYEERKLIICGEVDMSSWPFCSPTSPQNAPTSAQYAAKSPNYSPGSPTCLSTSSTHCSKSGSHTPDVIKLITHHTVGFDIKVKKDIYIARIEYPAYLLKKARSFEAMLDINDCHKNKVAVTYDVILINGKMMAKFSRPVLLRASISYSITVLTALRFNPVNLLGGRDNVNISGKGISQIAFRYYCLDKE